MANVSVSKAIKVSLELEPEEAVFLISVLGCIGGDVVDSPRRYAAAISDALGKTEFKRENYEKDYREISGSYAPTTTSIYYSTEYGLRALNAIKRIAKGT